MNIAAAIETTKPIGDVHSSAEYRKAMVRALTKRGVTEIWNAMRG